MPADLLYYHRNLPHRLPPGETLFITFRLAGSLPQTVVEKLQAEWENHNKTADTAEKGYAYQKRYFGRFDQVLDQATYGSVWLKQPQVANIVQQALHHFDQKAYMLIGYCVMPNHVHLLVTLPDEAPPLARTLQAIKSYSATQANQFLGRSGQFWQRESYDHIVRNTAELARIIAYIVENPVKAGLVTDWQDWPYTYWQE